MIACSIALAIWCAALSWLHHRDDMIRSLDGIEQDGASQDMDKSHTKPAELV